MWGGGGGNGVGYKNVLDEEWAYCLWFDYKARLGFNKETNNRLSCIFQQKDKLVDIFALRPL